MSYIIGYRNSDYARRKDQYFMTDGIKRQQMGTNQAPIQTHFFSESKETAAEHRELDPP